MSGGGPAGGSGNAGGSGASARGRPRSEAADRAILRAATDLLAERGLAGMSMEEVAARAGVGKATVYRRWRSRGALALDAFMAEFQALQPLPDTGTLRGDLLAALRAWVRAVTRTPAGRILAGLIAAAQEDPELAAAWRPGCWSRCGGSTGSCCGARSSGVRFRRRPTRMWPWT